MLQSFETEHLVLRPYELSDVPRVQKLAGEKELAETTFLPHPFTIKAAEDWIKSHSTLIDNGNAFPFAIILKVGKRLVGTMTIRIDKIHNKGELAYWIGKDYWGKGYATEASKKIVAFGFAELSLNRIWAPIMSKNKASRKVMEKVGLKFEGTLKQDILKWGKYEDVDVYGILREDYKSLTAYDD